MLLRNYSTLLIGSVLLLVCSQQKGYAQKQLPSPVRNFLSVSDIHFNPFYDTSLVDTLVKTPVDGWAAIFGSSSIQQPNSYYSDANYPLVSSALSAMHEQDSVPAFILITGDFLAHSFQSNFGKYAPAYPDSLQSFTAKTIQFIAGLFDKTFPHTVVLPALGNNDSYCGDYNLAPNSPFLSMFARAWAPLLRNNDPAKDSAFISQFSKGGYYAYTFRMGRPAKLLVLNTIFFSAKYVNTCGPGGGNPVKTEMEWLSGELKRASLKKLPVWLSYHISPGLDVYATIKKGGSCPPPTLMYNDTVNSHFLAMLEHHASTIRAIFAGHTHMDDFRVLYKDNKPVSFIHITPAISPLFGNNPGFQLFAFNRSTMELLNMQAYHKPLNVAVTAPWGFEYDYDSTYRVSAINATTLGQVRRKLATDSACRAAYINFYSGGNPASGNITDANWKAYWCGTGSLTAQAFSNCYCLFPQK